MVFRPLQYMSVLVLLVAGVARSQFPTSQPSTRATKSQAELEADFAKMMTNATLDGSYVSTGPGADPTRLSTDQYSLGVVRKLEGKNWLINARMNYGVADLMIPLSLPVEWAGDTPVIVVDNFTIPGMGTFNARVMFFSNHYSGYWSHGNAGGILFGIVRRAPATTAPSQ